MDKKLLSVVIIAKNEGKRITACIDSVRGWADEILVVDDESTDSTVKVAQELGAKVLIKKMEIEGKHRNWTYVQAKNDWVFSLDADERLTDDLKKEITDLLSSNPEFNVFSVPRRNFIGDYWIRWGGFYPAPQIKLFRKDKFKWEEAEVHPRAFPVGKVFKLKSDLIHFTYRNWGDFLRKLDGQTSFEAKKWYKLFLDDPKKGSYKMNTIHALWRVVDRFFRCYIGKQGFRDGFIGFMIAYYASLYQIVSYAKFREFQKNNNI